MVGENSNRMMWLGVVVSLSMHLGAAWVLMGSHEPSAEAAFQASAPPPEQEKKIDLGDPESTAMSMSWLGADEYQRHIAFESEVDQAELTMDPAAPTSAASAATAAAVAKQARKAASEMREQAQRMIEELAGGFRALEAWGGALPLGEGSRAGLNASEEGEATEREDVRAEAPQGEQNPEEGDAQEAETGAPQEVVSTESPAQRASEGAVGQQDDRESDATSIEQANRKELGKVLSARGLKIRTVKPRFSTYASIMSNPLDPVLRIHFGPDGRVAHVELVQSSGFGDIDQPVIDAAYRWSAEGKSLQGLSNGQTVSIDMRILL